MKWLTFVFLISLFMFWGCQPKTQDGGSETESGSKTIQVNEAQNEHQSALKTMERLNADLISHYNIYRRSNKNGDYIDELENEQSREAVISEANNLIAFCNEGLSKDYIINNVSNSRSTYLEYRKAAEDILEKIKQ